MTTTDLTTPMRDLHERGQRRVPCDGYELHREHGDAHMHGTVITNDCSGTTLDPSPAADLARAVADGVPAVEGEVCPCLPSENQHECTACQAIRIHESNDTHGSFCNFCHGTGYVGGLPALEGALVACPGRDYYKGSLRGCRVLHPPMDGEEHPDDEERLGDVERGGHIMDTTTTWGEWRRYCLCKGTGLVLNPDWARDLAAGEVGALVGRIVQRLRRVGARVWWENRNESANVGCIIRGALDGNLPSLHVRTAGFPSQLDALLDALAKAAGVGSAA